jgi:capsular polysaccharide transport system permease protein
MPPSSPMPPAAPLPGDPLPEDLRPLRRPFASTRTIVALMLREMATTNGRSPGGYLWAVLQPVGGIALLTVLFSLALRNPPLGVSFALFYASGIVPFLMYLGISNRIALSVVFSRPLLAYPSVTFIDAILARFLLNFLTEVMVAYLVFAGILMFFDTRAILDLPSIALSLGLSGILALGVGTLNCYLFTRFPAWQQVWAILMRPMFLVSCVLMVFDSLPRFAREILWYNPLVHLVGLMRRGFYASYDAPYASPVYVLVISGICLLMGLILLRRNQYQLLNL